MRRHHHFMLWMANKCKESAICSEGRRACWLHGNNDVVVSGAGSSCSTVCLPIGDSLLLAQRYLRHRRKPNGHRNLTALRLGGAVGSAESDVVNGGVPAGRERRRAEVPEPNRASRSAAEVSAGWFRPGAARKVLLSKEIAFPNSSLPPYCFHKLP